MRLANAQVEVVAGQVEISKTEHSGAKGLRFDTFNGMLTNQNFSWMDKCLR